MPIRGTYASQISPPLLKSVTSDTFTTATDLCLGTHAAGTQSCVIPANYFQTGGLYRVEAYGTFSTTATPTFVFGTYFGTTALGVNSALTAASGAVTLDWHLRTTTTVWTASPNTVCVTVTQGELWYGTTLTAITQIPIPGAALAPVNVDNSAAQPLTVKCTCNTSSVSNIVVMYGFSVEEVTQI